MHIFDREKSFMKRVATGDEKSCRHFVNQYMSIIYSVAMRTLGNDTLAEDIVQDVFIKVWRKAGDFNGDAKIKTWVYRITVNTCLDALRRQKSHDDITEYEIASDRDMLDVSYLKTQTVQQIQIALEQLRSNEKIVIVLFYWHEKKIKEIADIIDMKEKATESLLRRSRSKLAHILKGKI